MTSSSIALQSAIFTTLQADTALLALLGGPRIHDYAPQPVAFPYVTFGQSLTRDTDTSLEPGDEHVLTLHVWSRTEGRKEAAELVAVIRDALHDRPLPLTGHRLVNLRHEFSELRRDADGETVRGLVRFRAVTEPA